MIVLGIESTCDETAASLVEDGRRLLSNVISTSVKEQALYGGVVPEIASRRHCEFISATVKKALLDAGKRTWEKELMQSNVRPTLPDAVAGDITAAMPYRAMINIINFIQAVDHVVPGFAGTETLLYSPELKFYSNKVKMDDHFNTNVSGLHCLGDSSGWTRGLMMASTMGVIMAHNLIKE